MFDNGPDDYAGEDTRVSSTPRPAPAMPADVARLYAELDAAITAGDAHAADDIRDALANRHA